MKDQELVITRFFDAACEEVWKAWTEPDRLMKWWGPKDYSSPSCKIDLRVDGKYIFCMRSKEGKDFFSTGTYSEIVPFEKLACSDSFSDEKGNIVPASHYEMAGDFPMELQISVTFEKSDNKTKMTLHHAGIPPGTITDLTQQGWNESFDKLEKSLK